jgi:hypothetical protein
MEKLKESTKGWMDYINIISNFILEYVYPVMKKVSGFIFDIAGKLVEFVSNSTLIKDLFSTIGFILSGVFQLIGQLIDALKWTFDNIVMPIINAIERAWRFIHGYKQDDETEKKKEKGLIGGPGSKTLIPGKPGGTGKPGGDGTNAPTPKTKAEGQKTINIHVAYNAPLMSGGITISTTNLHEGAGKIKEILTEMLVGATHDTLMVADY